jgi:glucose-6-phosphate isomerase
MRLQGDIHMLNKMNPKTTKSWQNLHRHYGKIKNLHMKTLFAEDPQRFNKFSIRFNDILVDYSKNRITEETVKLLMALAEESGLTNAIENMFGGERINETETRAVLHTSLRIRYNTPIVVDGNDVMPAVNSVLKKM